MRRTVTLYALLAFAATLAFIIFAALPTFTAPLIPVTVITALISLLVLLKLMRLKQPQSRSDFNDLPISLPRLRATIINALLIALLALYQGDSGFLLLAPLWSALLTASL